MAQCGPSAGRLRRAERARANGRGGSRLWRRAYAFGRAEVASARGVTFGPALSISAAPRCKPTEKTANKRRRGQVRVPNFGKIRVRRRKNFLHGGGINTALGMRSAHVLDLRPARWRRVLCVVRATVEEYLRCSSLQLLTCELRTFPMRLWRRLGPWQDDWRVDSSRTQPLVCSCCKPSPWASLRMDGSLSRVATPGRRSPWRAKSAKPRRIPMARRQRLAVIIIIALFAPSAITIKRRMQSPFW